MFSPSDLRNKFEPRLLTLQEAAMVQAVIETIACGSMRILQASGCHP